MATATAAVAFAIAGAGFQKMTEDAAFGAAARQHAAIAASFNVHFQHEPPEPEE
jgi:hypothetical protein